MTHINRLVLKNFRCFRELDLELRPVQVFFGPNGSGKSTVLESLEFVRDWLASGPTMVSAVHSFNRRDDAPFGEPMAVSIDVGEQHFSVGEYVGATPTSKFFAEELGSTNRFSFTRQPDTLLVQPAGSGDAYSRTRNSDSGDVPQTHRHDSATGGGRPSALTAYVSGMNAEPSAVQLNRILRSIAHFPCRRFRFDRLRKQGSDSHRVGAVYAEADNLWATLRSIQDYREFDSRFDTVVWYMQRAFPNFMSLSCSQPIPQVTYANYKDRFRKELIPAAQMPDGYLSLLVLLTALFHAEKGMNAVLLLDEPDLSLHPWAIKVLTEAIREAATDWGRQVILTTHSPTLIDEFSTDELVAFAVSDSGARVPRPLSKADEWREILDAYTAGSLYMAEAIAPQSPPPVAVPPATVPPGVP
jgi:predicted ATPase